MAGSTLLAHGERGESIDTLHVHRDHFFCVKEGEHEAESQLKECRHRPLSFAA